MLRRREMIDIMRPYVCIHSMNNEIMPFVFSSYGTILNLKDSTIILSLIVGGAISADHTFLICNTADYPSDDMQ